MSEKNNASAPSPMGKKRLLVVGVNGSNRLRVQFPLKYPEGDAEGISWRLRDEECGFKSFQGGALHGKSASTRGVEQAVTELIVKSNAEDLLLFYFIGHSYATSTNEGDKIYLVTSDFDPDEVAHQPHSHLSLDWIWSTFLDNEKLSNVIVILDCCNAGGALNPPSPSGRVMRSLEVFLDDLTHHQVVAPLQNTQATRTWAIIVSTEANTPAYEGNGHTRMTGLILDALKGRDQTALDRNGDLTLFDLFKYLQRRMPELGPQRQNPIMKGTFSAERSWILAQNPEDNFSAERRWIVAQDPVRTDPDSFRPSVPGNLLTPVFDETICQEASVADLDMDQARLFLQKPLVKRQDEYRDNDDEQQQLEAFGLLQNGHPSYGALLCFGRRPSRQITGAYTRCISWREESRYPEEKVIEREYRSSLLEQFTQARNFLIQHLGDQIAEGDKSEPGKLYVRVLEEALANALIHREYVTEPGRIPRSEGVMVEIFRDRIEILSPGGPPLNIDVLRKAAEQHPASHPRNPQIMRIFYLAGHVDRAGTGITRMEMWMKEAGLPKPDLGLNEPRQTFFITLYRLVITPSEPGPQAIGPNGQISPALRDKQGSVPPSIPVSLPQQRHLVRTALSIIVVVTMIIGFSIGTFTVLPQWYISTFVPPSTTIEIASELPTSGVDKIIGLPVQNGIQMAIDDTNTTSLLPGYTLKLTAYNDVGRNNRHDPLVGANNLNTAIADNLVAGVVGPYNSAVAEAELPIANQAAIALVSPSNTYPCLTKDDNADPGCSGSRNIKAQMRPTGLLTYFRLSTTDDREGRTAADFFFKTQHYHKVLLLKDNSDVYSFGLAQEFQHEWEHLGGKVIPLGLSESASSIQDYQNTLQTTAASLQPDLIYFAGNDPNGTYALRALSNIPQLKSVTFAGASGIIDDSFLQAADQLHRSAAVYVSSPIQDPAKSGQAGISFENKYKARGYTDYRPYAASGYDSTMILIQAIRTALQQKGISTPHGRQDQAGARRFRRVILQALGHLSYTGATGTQSFDINGDTTNHTISFYQLNPSSPQASWTWLKQVKG